MELKTEAQKENDMESSVKSAVVKKRNNNMKSKVIRTGEVYETAINALSGLKGLSVENVIKDYQIIKNSLKMILELRNTSGISYKVIYETLRKNVGLTISLNTFKVYIQQFKNEEGLTNKKVKHTGKKEVRLWIREECAEKLTQLVEYINQGDKRVACAGLDRDYKKGMATNWEINFDFKQITNQTTN